MFDIANQLLTRHSPFASLGKVDEWTAKPSTFSIQGRLSESFWIKAAKTLSVSLKESDVQTFPEERPKYGKKNRKLHIHWLRWFELFQRIFSSWALAPSHITILFGNYRSLYFHSLIWLTFLVCKGLLCLSDKQNNTWLLVRYEFSPLVFNSKRNSISTRAHVLFFIY